MYFDDNISASPAAKIKSHGANIGLAWLNVSEGHT